MTILLTKTTKTFYAKDLNEPKYQFLIKKWENAGINLLNDPKAFTEHSAYMDDVCNNINDYSPDRKKKYDCVG